MSCGTMEMSNTYGRMIKTAREREEEERDGHVNDTVGVYRDSMAQTSKASQVPSAARTRNGISRI